MASNRHHPKFPPSVIPSLRSGQALSEAKDLSGWAEMLRCAQHDNDRLSMTMLAPPLLPLGVILSTFVSLSVNSAKGRRPTQAHSRLRVMPIGGYY